MSRPRRPLSVDAALATPWTKNMHWAASRPIQLYARFPAESELTAAGWMRSWWRSTRTLRLLRASGACEGLSCACWSALSAVQSEPAHVGELD